MAAELVLIGLLDASCPALQLTPLDSKIGGLPVSIIVNYPRACIECYF